VRVGYVVDVHGRFEAVADAVARIGPLDVLVVGGDITTFGGPADAERALALWQPLAPLLLAVAGNCDSPAIDEVLMEHGVSLDGRGIAVDGIGFAGVSASPFTPLDTPHELPDEEIGRRGAKAIAAVAGCRARVFCPHAPPHGTSCDRLRSGQHVGSPALRRLVEREQPDVVLCGHIHESRGLDRLGSARIVNPGPVAAGHYALVELGETLEISLD
jgi:Icc-related predicted phosphoesterase